MYVIEVLKQLQAIVSHGNYKIICAGKTKNTSPICLFYTSSDTSRDIIDTTIERINNFKGCIIMYAISTCIDGVYHTYEQVSCGNLHVVMANNSYEELLDLKHLE